MLDTLGTGVQRRKQEAASTSGYVPLPPLLAGIVWLWPRWSCSASQDAVSRVTVSWITLMREREAAFMVRINDGDVGRRGYLHGHVTYARKVLPGEVAVAGTLGHWLGTC